MCKISINGKYVKNVILICRMYLFFISILQKYGDVKINIGERPRKITVFLNPAASSGFVLHWSTVYYILIYLVIFNFCMCQWSMELKFIDHSVILQLVFVFVWSEHSFNVAFFKFPKLICVNYILEKHLNSLKRMQHLCYTWQVLRLILWRLVLFSYFCFFFYFIEKCRGESPEHYFIRKKWECLGQD